jgi:hypothetical protein
VVDSYNGFRDRTGAWSSISVKAILDSRGLG